MVRQDQEVVAEPMRMLISMQTPAVIRNIRILNDLWVNDAVFG